ncbi:CNDH2 protein, partial [Smithornis capensis]|nr:CNDH2 protein [Smithornis capensis]
MEEVDSRFLHLLQPIRDLTKNWEVDVAAQLGEYLEELDQICISFDNGKTTMNFMEAALLIQGSACVYSRKAKLPTSLGPDGQDADATFTDQEEEFLSLDDIQDTSQASVDMRRDQQPSAVNIVPLTPMSLVPPEEAEKKENPLLSRKGEVLASRKDFRMNTCTPHSTGALLLELAGLSPTHPQQHPGSPSTATGTWGAPRGAVGAAHLSLPLSLPPSPATGGNWDPGSFSSLCPFPPGAAEDDDVPGALGNDVEMTPALNEHVEAQRSVPQAQGYVLRERAPCQDPKSHDKEVPDPWQSLDPFGDSEEKPFRKGRPFLVPHGLDDVVGGKRKRKGPRKLQDFMRWFSAAYNNVTDGRKSRRKGPTFADLEVLYWRELKERLAAQRKLQTRRVSGGGLIWGVRGTSTPLGALGSAGGAQGWQGAPGWARTSGAGTPGVGKRLAWEGTRVRGDHLGWAEATREGGGRGGQDPGRPLPPLCPLTCPPCPQETRAPFDMRGYGLALAGACGELGRWHSLASLVAGQPPFEVCRYLLASLQLANDSVVELAQEPGLEAALDTARLRLLTLRPAHERFQGYQPPSLRD